MNTLKLNLKNTTPFYHYWETCVGSCHAYTALRADYRKQLIKAHEELGFRYVRFHGLFNDDMSVCTKTKSFKPEDAVIQYNFVNIDNIIDFLLENGMRPFFELGDMPACLASGERENFDYHMHIAPPADYSAWNELIEKFVSHICSRYGLEEVRLWFFEVWNEPNMPFFWAGSMDDYFKLYEGTARTIKK